jgi:hypothetical protein
VFAATGLVFLFFQTLKGEDTFAITLCLVVALVLVVTSVIKYYQSKHGKETKNTENL